MRIKNNAIVFSATSSLYFLLIALYVLMLNACKQDCSKKVPCPGYSDAVLDKWFPYFDKELLVFKSNTGLYDTLSLNLTDSTIAYEYGTGLGRPDNGCNASKYFVSSQTDSTNIKNFSILLNSDQDAYSTSKKRSASIYFYKQSFYGQDLGDNGFAAFTFSTDILITPKTFTNYELNGKIYPIAQSVTVDSITIKNAGVYKITFAKNYGIIAYESNPGAVTWVKQ